ncbi:MAG: hypothetical protein NUV49_01090 [Patescibacteria group bacterium]|nr:hypothetical protein [Patescibacteria group bacterium]
MEKENKKIIQISFLSSLGVLLYVTIVVSVMQNIEKLGNVPGSHWGPVIFLMLFVFSALVTSLLVFGYPVWLYMENRKKDAVTLLLCNVGWLFVMLILAFIIVNIIS